MARTIVTCYRIVDPVGIRATSAPSYPLSAGAASLSCLAAEHYQIHDQDALDSWRIRALHTIDDLYGQKVTFLRHEAHVSALLGQLRAIINEELPRHGSGYFIDDQHVRQIHLPTNGS
ncbi:hypothetical protein I4U23_024466 [Adineta vaga]|nr:hypothetical protein I4U23_024466 [Adineta vaga]